MDKQKINKIRALIKKHYRMPKTALGFETPIEILVATILSAQCTDIRVNIVTKELFKKYKTPKDYANANLKEFEQEIRSTGFYRNKAKNIINSAKMIIEKFNSKVPQKMEDLIQLPGVARKTANIVQSSAYGIIEGMAVDTHVKRLSYRMGLTKNKDPVKIEKDLIKIIPKKEWDIFSLQLVFHGRKLCYARKPNCAECFLNKLCPSAFKV